MCSACHSENNDPVGVIVSNTDLGLTPVKLTVNATRSYDPTRTSTLRNTFVRESNKRFKRLAKAVTKVVGELDFFGLNNNILVVNAIPNSQRIINAFLQWLEGMEQNILLDEKWLNLYIKTAYEQGIVRARAELRKAGVDVGEVDNTLRNLLGEQSLSALPQHIDKIGVIYSRVFTELKGITAEMNNQIVRILAQGLIEGQSPRRLAQMINSAIIETKQDFGLNITYTTKTGKQVSYFMSGRRRAEILTRTEVVRDHHLAMIQEYRYWKVLGVKVMAEFSTAKDQRVCPTCASLEGSIWTLDAIETMIPVHAMCRCVALPFIVNKKK